MTDRRQNRKLVVLLATLNGARHLDRQLGSILAQDWDDIDIIASDDGSTDETPSILETWRQKWNKGSFEIVDGPGQGAAENFRSLILQTPLDADYFAFSDQDDIWMPQKTSAAASKLPAGPDRPGLYGARTVLADETGEPYGFSPLFRRTPCFRNALIQNIAGGNTMVINRAGFALLRAASASPYVAHDWFAYMLISGAGGEVTYSAHSHVLYCQHDSNVVGANIGMAARWHRLKQLLRGRFRDWNDINVAALQANEGLLNPSARAVLRHFAKARSRIGPPGLFWLQRSGVYRQTLGGQLALYVACLIGKV